ncbi:MAG: hypothetical protein ABIH52_01140 [Candidatus Aenigmatarchaeota archaeon]
MAIHVDLRERSDRIDMDGLFVSDVTVFDGDPGILTMGLSQILLNRRYTNRGEAEEALLKELSNYGITREHVEFKYPI